MMNKKLHYFQMNYALFQINTSVQIARFFSSRNREKFLAFPAAHLSCPSEGSVDLSSLEGDGQVEGLVLQKGEAHIVLGAQGSQ